MPVLTKINTNVIADDAVTAAKIPAGAVAADIGANGIGLSELDNTATGIAADYHKVPVFADDAARNAAISSPANGMIIYNTDAGAVQQYNGVWSTIAPAPIITSISGFLNNDNDATLTVFGQNFNASTSVKMFDAASGGTQIGSNATVTFNSVGKLTAVFGAGSIGASGSTAYIEVDNSGATSRFATGITVNADPTVVHAGATGTGANTTNHLGTYSGTVGAGGPGDTNTKVLLNFDRANNSTDIEDSSNTDGDGHKATAEASTQIKTAQSKFGGSSIYYDGDSAVGGDRIRILTPPTCLTTSAAWTIEFWIRYTSNTATLGRSQTIFRSGVADASGIGHNFRFYFHPATTTLVGYFLNGTGYVRTGSVYHVTDFQTTYPPGQWHHWAFTHTAAGVVHLYMNGRYVAPDGDNDKWAGVLIGGSAGGICFGGGTTTGEGSLLGYMDDIRISDTVRYTGTTTSSDWSNITPEITSSFGGTASPVIPTITFTGSATQLAADEDIEFTAVENSGKPDDERSLIDTDLGLTLTNLTGADKNKATLTGTLAAPASTTYTNMPLKLQVRKTLGNAAYANASRTVTFSSSTTTAGLAPAMPVSGTGIPAGTTITSVDTSTTITLSANPTGGTLTSQSLIFLDPTRVSHQYNGSDTINNADAMYTIATGAAGGSFTLFNGRRYVGTGAVREITGIGFRPDLIWIWDRAGASHNIFDSVKHGGYTTPFYQYADTTGQPETQSDRVTLMTTDGYTLGANGNVNSNNAKHISYCFKAGGIPTADGKRRVNDSSSETDLVSSNTVGANNYHTEISNVKQSVNSAGDFSITRYDPDSTGNDTHLCHGLTGAPDFVIIKGRDTNPWVVYHSSMLNTGFSGARDFFQLNSNAAVTAHAEIWGDTFPSATSMYFGAHSYTNTTLYMMYAWKAKAGVSKFGSFTINTGNSPLTISGVGFKPRFGIFKDLAANQWLLIDSFRGSDKIARITTSAEFSGGSTTVFNSDGMVTTIGAVWENGHTYTYALFA